VESHPVWATICEMLRPYTYIGGSKSLLLRVFRKSFNQSMSAMEAQNPIIEQDETTLLLKQDIASSLSSLRIGVDQPKQLSSKRDALVDTSNVPMKKDTPTKYHRHYNATNGKVTTISEVLMAMANLQNKITAMQIAHRQEMDGMETRVSSLEKTYQDLSWKS
jgi:hypothetical protein